MGGLTWQVRLRFFHGPLRHLAEDPDRFGCRDGLVVKQFKPEKRAAIISKLFRGSRARRTYRRFYHLELLGIPAPRPVAFADRRKTGFPVCSYLVTREIPEARTLASMLEGKVPLERSVLRNLAQLIGKLHDEGFSAPDLEPTSFLVGLDKAVFLMDPDRLYFGDVISEGAAATDLARLVEKVAASPAVGRLERFVFLRVYCRTRGLRQVPRSDRLTHCPPHSTP
jgi:tRNA A-37 threonylcarbamoyl transferase component Bud32